jgi:hypothetical protein
MNTQKKAIYITVGIIVVLAGLLALYFFGGFSFVKKTLHIGLQPTVVQENLVIPDTQKITGNEGRAVEKGSVSVSLVPKDESQQVIVAKAVLTVKGSYALAAPEAQKWSSDAKLVFVKSLGAITLEGKSSQWQVVFAAKSKTKKAYETIIQSDQIVSKKEISSTSFGADVPASIKDSGDAIKDLQSLPQFSNATVSSIHLYYNLDAKAWFYSFATSLGTTSGPAQ